MSGKTEERENAFAKHQHHFSSGENLEGRPRHSHFPQDWVNVCGDLGLGKVLEHIHEVAFRKPVLPLACPLSRLLWFGCRVTFIWRTKFQTEPVIRHVTSVTLVKHRELHDITHRRDRAKDQLKMKTFYCCLTLTLAEPSQEQREEPIQRDGQNLFSLWQMLEPLRVLFRQKRECIRTNKSLLHHSILMD